MRLSMSREFTHLRDAFPRLVKWTKDYVDKRLADFETAVMRRDVGAEVDDQPTLRITGAFMDQACNISTALDAHSALHAASMAPFRPASACVPSRARAANQHPIEAPEAVAPD